jgi:hypothetical protein
MFAEPRMLGSMIGGEVIRPEELVLSEGKAGLKDKVLHKRVGVKGVHWLFAWERELQEIDWNLWGGYFGVGHFPEGIGCRAFMLVMGVFWWYCLINLGA